MAGRSCCSGSWIAGRQAKGVQPANPAGRRLLRLLGILVVGVAVIVGVFYLLRWVMATQPTVGNLNLATVVVALVIVAVVATVILHYVGLLKEVISFFSRIIGKS